MTPAVHPAETTVITLQSTTEDGLQNVHITLPQCVLTPLFYRGHINEKSLSSLQMMEFDKKKKELLGPVLLMSRKVCSIICLTYTDIVTKTLKPPVCLSYHVMTVIFSEQKCPIWITFVHKHKGND